MATDMTKNNDIISTINLFEDLKITNKAIEKDHIEGSKVVIIKHDDMGQQETSNRESCMATHPQTSAISQHESIPRESKQQRKNGVDSAVTNRPVIICDCWYGWPKQKKPKSERIRAVSNQLVNFLLLRQDLQKHGSAISRTPPCTKSSLNGDMNTSKSPLPSLTSGGCCDVVVIGKKEDLSPLQVRMSNVAPSSWTLPTSNNDLKGISFLPDSSAEEFIISTALCSENTLNSATNTERNHDEVIYLSPDADDILDPSKPPPRRVVVGMIVDRRVTVGRSRDRAATILATTDDGIATSCRSASLPLGLAKLEGLEHTEPLNIDTVLEIMERWWKNYSVASNRRTLDCDAARNTKCFIDAAITAMLSHQERHPNRTLHASN